MAKGNKKSPANANGNAQQLRCMFESPVKQSLSQSPEDARRFLYARKQNASRVFAIVWASVCPSVRHTRELYQNGASQDHEIFTVDCPKVSIVYRDKISCHWVQGFPPNEGVEEGYPP